ncbi:uncharacterized protein BKCO1_300084 [Diplodia corticola]|uniref:GIY-YIG domain-containing protein n=1 Tax=Diplodia corticola TaxID=236234 RepID=A0A1J9RG19_9PEZI|nr:uncharacterized protein BKCO1_300084 [Diplodia corticola]OJD39026.1 hypothetical protein BKCO1_300084 [Diplodia corticola]
MSQNPIQNPTWPKGYPFVAVQDHQSSQHDTVNVINGDLGRVIAHDPKSERCMVIIESRGSPGSRPCGWVSMRYIEIGQVPCVSRVEDLSIETNLPRPNSSTQTVKCTTGSFSDPFRKAATAMFSAYILNGNADLKGVVPHWLLELNSQDKLDSFLAPVFAGVGNAGLAGVLANPDVTVADITSKATLVDPSNHRGGIYMIRLADFKDKRSPELYIGQTYDFSSRAREHRASSKERNQAIYRSWRECTDQKMYIVCLIDGQGKIQKRQRTVAEQMFICLLETYHPDVLDPARFLTAADMNEAGLMGTDSTAEAGKSVYHHQRHAAVLQYFERCTREKSGWKGGVSRQQKFGAARGLNWSSPLVELFTTSDKVLWLKTSYPDMDVYRRSPTKIYKHRTGYLIVCKVTKHHWASGGKMDHSDVIEIVFPKDTEELSDGMEVNTVIEIAPGGQHHPVPYARLAGVGPWTNWDQANRVGIKVEWQDEDGQWKHRYCQSTYGGTRDTSGMWKDPGHVKAYGKTVALIHYFSHEVQQPMVKWPESYGTAEVKEMKYDHLRQKIRFVDVALTTRSIAPPQKLSHQAIEDKLRAASDYPELGQRGQTKIGGEFQKFPTGATPRYRPTCDGCHLGNVDPRRGCKAEANTGNACKPCYRLGLPCTWTATAALNQKPRLIQALKAPDKHTRSLEALEVDDPHLVMVNEDED